MPPNENVKSIKSTLWTSTSSTLCEQWEGSLASHGICYMSRKGQKTRLEGFNYFQMFFQKQHFLLSYLKTLSLGPAGF